MNKIKKNHLYCCAASIAFVGLSSSAWGMDYLYSLGETENSVKSKLVSGLAPQVLPPSQDGKTMMTRSRGPALSDQRIEENRSFVQEKKDFQEVLPGEDDRIQVKHPSIWPHSVHGMVKVTLQQEDNHYTQLVGSGTLIAPNLVLTAAQNLYATDSAGRPIGSATQVKFCPGIDEEHNTPFGEQNVRAFYFPEEYKKDRTENYGLLVLENPIGESTGHFGLSVLSPEEVQKLELTVTGYSKDKALDKYKMCTMKRKPTKVTQNLIYYPRGNSWDQNGSGVWYKDNGNYVVVGVHTSDDTALSVDIFDGNEVEFSDTATLLTKPRYEKIRTWVKDSFDKFPASTPKDGMFSSVESADLESKYIGNFGVNLLCNYAKCLHTVNLSYNNIADDGFKFLIQHPTLTKLNLSHNSIILNWPTQCSISEAFSKNSKLSFLDLSYNLIGHDGAMVLSQSPNLTNLNLSNNKITDAGEVLLALAKNTCLKTLNFSNPYAISGPTKAVAGTVKAIGTVGKVGIVIVGATAVGAVTIVATNGAILGVATEGTVAIGGTATLETIMGKAVLGGGLAKVPELILGRAGAAIGNGIAQMAGWQAAITVGAGVNNRLNEAVDGAASTIIQWGGKFAIGKEEAEALSQNTTLTELDLSDTCVTSDILRILAKSTNTKLLIL